jgi:hypothetical protein
MSHLEVVRAFVRGRHRRGSHVFADESDDAVFSYGRHFPLVVRIPGGFLVNGNRYSMSTNRHRSLALETLTESRERFAVVPFSAIELAMARIDGVRFEPISELKKAVRITVPSSGERWQEVRYKKPDGAAALRHVHTLGDSVVRIRDHEFVSAVDETGTGRGLYFFTELPRQKSPSSVMEALDMLKPRLVLDAEKKGLEVRRQGEWFAVPASIATRQLMRDARDGFAVRKHNHVLGGDGHHRLTHAVIYKHGPQKGEVYARGTMRHIGGEHRMLALPGWFRIVRGVQGLSISVASNSFD